MSRVKIKHYDIILTGPPWFYTPLNGLHLVAHRCHYARTHQTGAALNYPVMTNDEIFNLDLGKFLNRPGILFLWATGPKLDVAFEAIERWSLFYRGMAFVWVKTKRSDGTPIGAKGPRPSIVKSLSEFVLVASNVKTGRPLLLHDETISQTIMEPVREHSRKPDSVQEKIERMYPGYQVGNIRQTETSWLGFLGE